MIHALEESIKYFFEEILKSELKKSDEISGELYGAAIVLSDARKNEDFHFYLFFPKEVFEKFRAVFLKNAKFSEDDWCDLAKEIANEIIGYAKSKLKRDEADYKLGIPEFLGRVDFSHFKLDKSFTYALDGHNFRIGFKKNG